MTPQVKRRTFLTRAAQGLGLGICTLGYAQKSDAPLLPEPSPAKLPRWRGFNLHAKFNGANERFHESDFAWIRELGFNFVRLPMDYRAWTDAADWRVFKEATLLEIDEAVRFGEQYGIHVQLNFHRAPGYTVAQPPEALSLWSDEEAQEVCALHWAQFAKRYKDIPSRNLSFNLFNEPGITPSESHRKVVERVAGAIREHDANRLIVCDGRNWSRTPPDELLGLNVAAATRGYEPFHLTHYKASWVKGADAWPPPSYPLVEGDRTVGKDELHAKFISPWKELASKGMGVMVGEFGAFNQTPHVLVLDWMRDSLALWRDAGWGWAMWDFRGSFGFLDSGRNDVTYEDFHGAKLDRAMLELLKEDLVA